MIITEAVRGNADLTYEGGGESRHSCREELGSTPNADTFYLYFPAKLALWTTKYLNYYYELLAEFVYNIMFTLC